jgi:serine/threonine protein phosphatase PrpC
MGCAPSGLALTGAPSRRRKPDGRGGDCGPGGGGSFDIPDALAHLLPTEAEGGPLSPEAFRARLLSSAGTQTVALPGAGFSVRYAFASLRGYYPEALNKPNQDAVCAHAAFGRAAGGGGQGGHAAADPGSLLVGVFDGHGSTGAACAQFAMAALPAALLSDALFPTMPELALRDATGSVNAALHASGVDDSMSGTTALVAHLRGRRLYVANVGDSRAVLGTVRGGGGDAPSSSKAGAPVDAVAMSWDHTPFRKDEYERVKRAGARVLTLDQMEGLKDASAPCWTDEDTDSADPPRLWMPDALYPGTAFTRSIGDAAAERIGVIPDAEVRVRGLAPGDRFLILASDGVWEFISNQEAVDYVAARSADPQAAALGLVVEAYRRWLANETRTDDITALVLCFDGIPTGGPDPFAVSAGPDGEVDAGSAAAAAAAAACARTSMGPPRPATPAEDGPLGRVGGGGRSGGGEASASAGDGRPPPGGALK